MCEPIQKFHRVRPALSLLAVVALATFATASVVRADYYEEEAREALQQTEDQFNAFKGTLDQTASKLDEIEKNYQKYKQIAYDPDTERATRMAIEVFGWDKNKVLGHLSQLRESFNVMDRNGFADKLKSASGAMKKGKSIADEVSNAYEFAQKFDPAKAEENPTYGLRLIGTFIKEGADKLDAAADYFPPGKILTKWFKMYADATVDYANALDRLDKKIREFRQGSLCGQSGKWVRAQKAFFAGQDANARFSEEVCQTFLQSPLFSRLRGLTWISGAWAFFYDPGSGGGYFANTARARQVYVWHGMLLRPRALTADWLADRANSLTNETIARARRYATKCAALYNRYDPGWYIIDAIGMWDELNEVGSVKGETFLANYILDTEFHNKVEAIMQAYRSHVLVTGRIKDADDDSRIGGATVSFVYDSKTYTVTSDQYGDYKVLMKGAAGQPISARVAKTGYQEVSETGHMPDQVLTGYNFSLEKESVTFSISGKVFDNTKSPPEAVQGAAVSASAGKGAATATTSAAGGVYSVQVQAPPGGSVTVSATKDGLSGSTNVYVEGESRGNQDIFMTEEADEEDEGATWSVTVTVLDRDGNPLAGATVTSGTATGTTDASGQTTLGPLMVDEDDPASLTIPISASVTTQDGQVIAGSTAVTYAGAESAEATVTVDVEVEQQVTITGRVLDANGIGVEGAVVTADVGASGTSAGGGTYSLGPIGMVPSRPVSLTATLTADGNVYSGGPRSVAYSGKGASIGGQDIALQMAQLTDVTISGRVIDGEGKSLPNAIVMCRGQQATTDGSGNFTIGPISLELGVSVTVTASIALPDGASEGGSASVTPNSDQASVTVTIAGIVQREEEDDDDDDDTSDLDSAISDILDDLTDVADDATIEAWWIELVALYAAFETSESEFYSNQSFFSQRVRELREQACEDASVAKALTQAKGQLGDGEALIALATPLYTRLMGALRVAGDRLQSDRDAVEGSLDDYSQYLSAMRVAYAGMIAEFGVYQCDEDQALAEGESEAQDDVDPDDRSTGASGVKKEVCGDGIDNNDNGLIDECEAGCCDKNVQITVEDCGNAADDIFQVSVDGSPVGVTPKGSANTFNIELPPGEHSLTMTTLEDDFPPGTVCWTIVVFGEIDEGASGSAEIALGQSQTFTFTVSTGPPGDPARLPPPPPRIAGESGGGR